MLRTKKIFEPYLLLTSLKYFKSLSPSKSKASEDASKLKFLLDKMKKLLKLKKKELTLENLLLIFYKY